ncbi:maleylpyruvate isomerase family mycothiol-dependent enzyme [Micromonospora sp. WMMA1363]|uniref:maleylpyruvate isomerase family mycothiol-dependent enzyme n=1 Tax=Micromonospora sp. WMMA1363 TaxID=3053985 RepID=UPI00259CEA91|nr:maleylpyruvate isomerase family mycothiol-dependent enzyme [Micromonospora sp. WMMA1363]MDM4719845.1 maleylpyruvate isomerase family mycothiol-dependent enzyme [Micromonospora sp. WMMA1363]
MDLTPRDLGARIMSAARARRAPGFSIESGETVADGPQVYEELTDVVAAVLHGLPNEGWAQPARPYRWSVHDLLGHLLAVERYTATRLGVPGMGGIPEPGDDHHLTFADAVIAFERTRAPTNTLADWWEVVGRVRDIARPGLLPDRPVALHGLRLHPPALLVLRGFELWIHAEDISRAVHAPPTIPSAGAVRAMAELSIGKLVPLALPAVRVAPARDVRVVLTGAGGGTWNLALGDGQASALLVLDVVEYCRYAAGRHDRADLDVHIEGDAALVEDVLAASRLLAV